MKATYHPRPDDAGKPVAIHKPHLPSLLAAWGAPQGVARVVPGGPVPASLNGVALMPWTHPPETDEGWQGLAALAPVVEPPFVCPAGMKPAAGALVVEPDGRAWCVAPSNRFGGHEFTLPKGRIDGRSLAATALVEVFEEAGLQIRLDAFLCDTQRKETFTRFFLGTRIGGSPATMGWESQSVVLAPLAALRALLTHPGDQLVLDAFDHLKGSS
jgi:8-oxo-dGTP pyrophosphatase MutT (NUDIX family)